MKRALIAGSRLSTLDPRPLVAVVLVITTVTSHALTEGNPYTTIVGRNTFALKPPPLPPDPTANKPPAQPPNISLQGISTILGRPQVLLKLKLPPKPPEGPKELSVVMEVGQREGEVEIVEINAETGAVKINNAGTVLSLNMKDNADKPAAGAALPAPAPVQPVPGGLPVPAPAPAAAANTGVSATTIGGAAAGTLPTRPIRSTPTAAATATATSTQTKQADLSPEAGAILLEVNRKMNPGLPYPPSRVKLE
jgi:hypothetical protein